MVASYSWQIKNLVVFDQTIGTQKPYIIFIRIFRSSFHYDMPRVTVGHEKYRNGLRWPNM